MADKPAKPPASSKKDAKRGPKVPRKITADRLRNIALYHLQRYATSADNLRRVLERRVFKASKHHETDSEQAKRWITEIVGGLVRSGAIDDSQYAEAKTRSMLRRGQSVRKVRAYLSTKGISSETIDQALNAVSESIGEPDLEAAKTYAMRRRLGLYRTSEASPEIRQKELAIMGRAGFTYDIARKIVDAEPDTD